MTVSIALQLADRLGHHRRQYLDEYCELRTAYDTLSPVEYRHVQPADIPLDVDHDDRWIGSLEYIERTADGDLWGVAVADDDWLLTLDDIYASTYVRHRRDGTDIELLGVALTHDPAGLCLRKATLIPGDFRKYEVRGRWHNKTPSRALFERAAEYAARRGRGPITIAGPRPITPREAEKRHVAIWEDEYGQRMAAYEAEPWVRPAPSQRNAFGVVEWSRPYNGVISVR
jgi:hypothetical protein